MQKKVNKDSICERFGSCITKHRLSEKLKNVKFHLISSWSQGVRQYFDCYILVAMRGRIPIRPYTSIMHSAILYYFTQKVYRNRVQDYQENLRVFIETIC